MAEATGCVYVCVHIYIYICMCVCINYACSIIFRAYKVYGNHIPSTCTKRKMRIMSSITMFP